MTAAGDRPLVLVTVGTDHHRFDRLVDWIERWLADGPYRGQVECLVQHGTSRAPLIARGVPFLGHVELEGLMRRAAVVVSHAGPSTVVEARRHGHRPVVTPRSPALGEHVDDHQLRFASRLARDDLVRLADTEQLLRAELGAALAGPRTPAQDGAAGGEAAALRFGHLVEALLARTR